MQYYEYWYFTYSLHVMPLRYRVNEKFIFKEAQ